MTLSLFDQDCQLSEYGIFNATCDPPMSFRDRHRFLDGVYNSYPDPASITADDMGNVAPKVGLLMEEVLAWFKDEKARRAELFAQIFQQTPKSTCQFPASPESIKGSGEVSSASPFDFTSPGIPSKPQEASSPYSASADQKMPAPGIAKRGRPPKAHIKTELDLSSPDAKRKKISVEYPCPDCQNFVPAERWVEHINQKHFPQHVWECPKNSRQTGKLCSSSPHYRPPYRDDNFSTHLKREHNCPDTEVAELKKTCKFELVDFFHKICGLCDISLKCRDESIDHIKDHFRRVSEEPNPPTDLGVSLWKEKCGVEHKLQLGIHYQKSQASKRHRLDEDCDHDRDEEGDGGRCESRPDSSGCDNSGHQNPGSRSNNSHNHDAGDNGASGDGNSNNTRHHSSSSQLNSTSHTHSHFDDLTKNHSNENIPNQPGDDVISQPPQIPTKLPLTKTRGLRSREEGNYQSHVKGCRRQFGRIYNFKAHLKIHYETHKHPFLCCVKDCKKTFEKISDLERYYHDAHTTRQNRCDHCNRVFSTEYALKK